MELSDYRTQIDRIDAELLRLFAERMQTAAGIAAYKKEHALPVLDTGREREKLAGIVKAAPEDLQEEAVSLFRLLFSLSRGYLRIILKEVFPLKHRTRCFGAAVLAALVLAMLCVPALAAEIAVDYTSEYQFSAADFSDSSELEGVYISAVPPAYQAELCIGSRVLRRGDILPAAALEKLKLRPVCLGEADCELVYCPISAGTLGDAVTVSLRILSGTNTAPVCEDGTLETYKNIANSGTLCAQDKEDTKLTYQLVKEPKRGTVELHDDGSFTYTPGKNKVGKDSFVFTATDPAGNVSNEACVKIRILKPADKATYQDMSGDKDAFAAMWLKDQGLYTGRIIAGNLCFEPDDAVSRGEFLIACMKLAGLEQADGAISTGFADELETPAWQQPYLAAPTETSITQVSIPSFRASSANSPSRKQTSRTCSVFPRPCSSDSTCVFAPPMSPPEISVIPFILEPSFLNYHLFLAVRYSKIEYRAGIRHFDYTL